MSATNLIGDSLTSGTLANVVAASLPSAPVRFARASTVTAIGTAITMQWTAPTDNGGSAIVSYQLMWNGGVIGGSVPADNLGVTSALVTFYTQSGLTKGRTYHFTVAAVNEVGQGPSTATLALVAC